MTALDPTPCPGCQQLTRRIAQLERDLTQTADAVDVLTHRLLEAREAKKGKQNG